MQTSGIGGMSLHDMLVAEQKEETSSAESSEFAPLVALSLEGVGAAMLQPGEIPFGKPGTREPISIEDIRNQYEQNLMSVQDQIRSLFQARGIEASPPVKLQTAPGKIAVTGEHPQKAEIEQIFRDSAELRNQFAETSAQATLLAEADQSAEMHSDSLRDPLAAGNPLSDLFGNRSEQFSLTLAGDLFLPLVA